MDGIAVDLAERGYVTWNLEYRRVGAGGGWPESFDDVAAALAAAADLTGIDPEDTALLGHSSGGTMALWAGGITSELAPQLTVGMAALTDLVMAQDDAATQESIRRLLGRTKPGAAEYSPFHRLPTGTQAIVAAATADDVAPPSRARDFAEQANMGGDTVAVVEVPGNDSSFLDPGDAAWKNVAEILTRQFGADL
jgi:acetyl esterase/lipase